MAATRHKIRAADVHGLKYCKSLRGLIELPDVSAGRFEVAGQTLTAVDGSIVETLARVARLSWLPKSRGKALCGYAYFAPWNVIVAKNSSSCCRIRDNSAHDVVRALELTDSDIAAGVCVEKGPGAFGSWPLTEPDLRATHPALWVPFSQVKQQRLTRGQFRARVEFLPCGSQ